MKDFFKPNKIKLILVLLLLMLSFSDFTSRISVSSLVPFDKPYCVNLQAESLNPAFITYIVAPFSIVLFGIVCNYFILALINLPYLYILVCVLSFISKMHYNNYKKSKK